MLALILACTAMAVAAPQALAATFGVNTTADSSDAGGCTTAPVCSLRDAVTAANAASGSTINVPAGHYTLNTGATPLGQLALTVPTTIVGAGARTTTVDGNGQSRVFDFEPTDATAVLEIENLTVTGGSAPAAAAVTDPGDGAGIFSLGGLDLEHVAVTANTAALGGGGVMEGTIHATTAPGPATFNGVTISGNHVQGGAGNGQGGGTVVATSLTMTNSTIANNTVSNPGVNEGGGLVSAVTGGTGVTATLVNDTITGNVAAQPVSVPAGDMGGGISGDDLGGVSETFDSVIAATNTIVAGNQADGTEGNCAVIDTTDGTSSHNIEGDASCGFSDAASKQTTAIALGPLQNNGGQTDTLLPTASSPAIDAGDGSACPATDERGVTRPQGAGCDIGATELAPPAAVTGAATSITPTGATASGTASNPAVADGTATIDYGTSSAYGQSASAGTLSAGSVNAPHAAALTGLTPGTTYHYRITVTTTDGTATGTDASFRTSLEPTSLTLTCSPASVKWKHSTTCAATVSDAAVGFTGSPTGSVHFTSTAAGSKFGSSGTCKLVATGISKPSRCSVSYAPTGSTGLRTITAAYSGDAQHAVSSGSYRVRVLAAGCAPVSGSLSGTRLGPVRLGATVAQTRKALTHYTMGGRRNMYFFCLAGGPGIRVGFLGGKAVLALTSRTHYHLGRLTAGDSLAKAKRVLRISSHFRIGINIWYIAAGGASNGVLKVRNGRVEEIGIANKKRTQTRATAFRFMSSFPKSMMS